LVESGGKEKAWVDFLRHKVGGDGFFARRGNELGGGDDPLNRKEGGKWKLLSKDVSVRGLGGFL